MTLRRFIRENRKTLDAYIAQANPRAVKPVTNDSERRLWILNDEGLYRWAKSEGVKI